MMRRQTGILMEAMAPNANGDEQSTCYSIIKLSKANKLVTLILSTASHKAKSVVRKGVIESPLVSRVPRET